MNKLLTLLLMMNLSCLLSTRAQAPMNGGVWKDNTGKQRKQLREWALCSSLLANTTSIWLRNKQHF